MQLDTFHLLWIWRCKLETPGEDFSGRPHPLSLHGPPPGGPSPAPPDGIHVSLYFPREWSLGCINSGSILNMELIL